MEVTRLFDAIYYQKAKFPQEKSLSQFRNGGWEHFSTDQIIAAATNLSMGLLKLGIQSGDKVALVVHENRLEWDICDIAIGRIGAINVPVYPTISTGEFEYIFNHAEVKACFASNEGLFGKVNPLLSKVSTLQHVYTFDEVTGARNWQEVLELGKGGDPGEVDKIAATIDDNQMATIIYTSGTTGLPKGVMLSHANIVSNFKATGKELPLQPGMRSLSFLPKCHIFERMVVYTYLYAGVNVYYSDVETLGEKLQTVKPHFFTTVPRLLEKVYEKIMNTGMTLTGAKKKLFDWALGLTDDYAYDKKMGFLFSIADKLIFSKWRAALGGEVVGVVTGSAPCPQKIARVFSAAGVPIREGYGLTETSPVLTFNRFSEGGALLGTVGIPIDDVEIKIAEDGEILAKGPNIMQGYYKEPDKTAEVMSGDGWFHTGDVGTFITAPNGKKFLKITDRKKELLKTSGGKYVAPAPIESKFRESFFVEQMMVVGEGKKFVSALIVPAFPVLEDWAKNEGIDYSSREDLITKGAVHAKFQSIVEELNPQFSHIEQIKKFSLLPNEWTVDTKELTPTMKIKRKVISEKYQKEIDAMYA
jgi:long-chain acyl-CoA synthetase